MTGPALTVRGPARTRVPLQLPEEGAGTELRDLHEQMLAAVMDGDGLGGIAELASHEVGGPVAIVLPEHGLQAIWPEAEIAPLGEWAALAIAGNNGTLPEGVDLAVPIAASGRDVGRVIALADSGQASTTALLVDREEVLRLAALTALTELAVVEARDQLAEELRGSLIEEMRAGAISGEEIVRRGQRLGADLTSGVVALAAEASGGKPRYMAAIISSVAGSAIAEPLGDRVFALLPTTEADGGADGATARAREIVRRPVSYTHLTLPTIYSV